MANDARFAYGIVHLFFSNAGASEDLGNNLSGLQKLHPGAAYIESVSFTMGSGVIETPQKRCIGSRPL